MSNVEIYALGRELDGQEVAELENASSLVKKVDKIKKLSDLLSVLEGLLYIVGDDGVSLSQCAYALQIGEDEALGLLRELREKYLSSDCGFEIVDYGQTYKLVSKSFVLPYAQRLFHNEKMANLSQSALETLAIIAYKQPITRVEVEELRGVGADMMLRKLQARGLIKEAGRADGPGLPILYEVTKEFLDSFKLVTLNELPDLPNYGESESENLFE